MKHHLRKPLALILALSLLAACLPAAQAAPEGEVEPPISGFRHLDLPGYRLPASTSPDTRDALPAAYSSVDLGLVTPVKDQSPYGTCWAFGTLSPIETYMIKQGIPVGDTGLAATTALDLSEYHLSYFTYAAAQDALGLTQGDSSILSSSHLSIGGDGYKSTLTLMRWEGPASEEVPALAYSAAGYGTTIDPAYAYAYDVAHVSDVEWVSAEERDTVKRLLLEYGSAFFGYYFNAAYNTTNGSGAYCCIQNVDSSGNYANVSNHAVTLVGWDDNYPKENFRSNSRPQHNGAWIVKNSWGTTGSNAAYTQNGYNYISYEDTASLHETCMFFRVEPVDNYQHIYQYDGTVNIDDYVGLSANHAQIANVFTAQGHERLEAVSILTLEEGLGYTLQLYTGLTNPADPTSGTLAATQEGTIAYHGYHTIPLETPVPLEAGETFSAVFTLHSSQPSSTLYMVLPIDANRTDEYWGATLTHTHAEHPNTSFFRLPGTGSAWSQPKEGAGSFRIKAYTSDDPYALTAVSADEALGTVSLGAHTDRGWVVTATPAAGYFASGWTLLSGSADVVQEGSIFYVEPREDSVLCVRFSPQTPVTVTFVADGLTLDTVAAVTGQALALPAAAPTPEGWTFLGWTPTPTQDALTQPQTFAPGGLYYPLGSDTLYALYSGQRLGQEGQDGSYVKITAADELTAGRYLIVNEARSLALNGALVDSAIDTLDNEMAVAVSNDRIPENEAVNEGAFTYDPAQGTLNGKRETSSGKVYYIGAPGNANTGRKYIYTTPYASGGKLRITFNADGSAKILDDYYTSYRLCYYESGSEANFRFTKAAANVYPIALYRKTEDTTQTFYTTGASVLTSPFQDVADPAAYFYAPVVWAYQQGVTVGTDSAHFSPDAPCTRAQIVTFLWRAYSVGSASHNQHTVGAATANQQAVGAATGRPSEAPASDSAESETAPLPFVDVSPTAYYYEAVRWAVDNGITAGVDETHFAPNAPCTRAQAVTLLWRASTVGAATGRPPEAPASDSAESETDPLPFIDVSPTAYYYEPVRWALEHSITAGTSPTRFSPDAPCTRGQIVTFLFKLKG